jgi:hypothetical protein
MDFDVSDVEEPVWRRARRQTEPIPIDEEDMLETACLVPPRRTAAGTRPPPPPEPSDVISIEIDEDAS